MLEPKIKEIIEEIEPVAAVVTLDAKLVMPEALELMIHELRKRGATYSGLYDNTRIEVYIDYSYYHDLVKSLPDNFFIGSMVDGYDPNVWYITGVKCHIRTCSLPRKYPVIITTKQHQISINPMTGEHFVNSPSDIAIMKIY